MAFASHIFIHFFSYINLPFAMVSRSLVMRVALAPPFHVDFIFNSERAAEDDSKEMRSLEHHKQNKGQTLISKTLCFDTNYEHFRKTVNFTIVKRVVGRRSPVVVGNTKDENGKMSFLSRQLTVDSRPFTTGARATAHQCHYCQWTEVWIRRCILFNKII